MHAATFPSTGQCHFAVHGATSSIYSQITCWTRGRHLYPLPTPQNLDAASASKLSHANIPYGDKTGSCSQLMTSHESVSHCFLIRAKGKRACKQRMQRANHKSQPRVTITMRRHASKHTFSSPGCRVRRLCRQTDCANEL